MTKQICIHEVQCDTGARLQHGLALGTWLWEITTSEGKTMTFQIQLKIQETQFDIISL